LHAEALRQSAPYRHKAVWEVSQATGLVGAAGGWAGPGALFDAELRLTLFQPVGRLAAPAAATPRGLTPLGRLGLTCFQMATHERDDMPPALLYLAIRAARRALVLNPDDAQLYQVLGECYVGLLHGTRERAWGRRLPRLVE